MNYDTDDPGYRVCLSVVSGAITIEDGAKRISQPVYDVFVETGGPGVEGELWELWGALVTAAVDTTPEEQGKLVELLAAVRSLPTPTREGATGNEVLEVWGSTWDELPIFGPTIAECWNLVGFDTRGFANFNAFAARVAAAKIADFAIYGLWALRKALEDPAPDEMTAQPSPNNLEAAASWFIYAGDSLRTFIEKNYQWEVRGAMAGASLKDKDWNGYNEERWGVWLERFRLAVDTDLPEKTKEMVTLAIEEMGRLSAT